MSSNSRKLAVVGAALLWMVASTAEAQRAGRAGGALSGAAARSAPTNFGNNRSRTRDRDISSSRNTNVRGGDRINTGDVNIGNDVNIDVDHGWGYNDHPIATGVAVGVAVGVTARAVIGASYYALPPTCVTYIYSTTYYYCGSVWYQPRYAGTSVIYVVVNPPN